MTGPHIELEFWNFDALYQAQNHPSRDWTQTYSLKHPKHGSLPANKIVSQVRKTHENGWKTGSDGWGYRWDSKKASNLMPRAHDTAISPRYLSGHSGKIEIPGKYFSLVRCFRPDVIDATHGVEFNQLGGFVIDRDLVFGDLLGLLKETIIKVTGFDKVRFRPDYFPFTEPSVEVSAKHPEMGWMELAGAGIFREELTKPLGIDEPVIAWGFGIDRLAMMKLNIKDIRELFSQSLDWLRNSEIVFKQV
jgi:phenylalanyl-tRNA synthetase alpha chain